MLVSLICILIGPQKIYPVSVVMDNNKRSSLKKLKWFPERQIPRSPLHKLHHYTFNVVQGYDEWSEQWSSDLTRVVSVLFRHVLKCDHALSPSPISPILHPAACSHLLRWSSFFGRTSLNFGRMDRAPCITVVVSLRQS